MHCYIFSRFALEGLSYLSLDADVKEWMVEDPLLLKALLVLAKVSYSILTRMYAIYSRRSTVHEVSHFSKYLIKKLSVKALSQNLKEVFKFQL